MSSSRKRSDIWNVFSTTSEEGSAKCTLCSGSFSYKGGATANLSRHLKRKHPTALVALGPSTSGVFSSTANEDAAGAVSDTEDDSTTTHTPTNRNTASTFGSGCSAEPVPKRKYQTTLTSVLRRTLPYKNSKKLDEQLTVMIAAEYHPFSLVEDKEFRAFVNMLNPNYSLPSRKSVSNVFLPQLYTKIRAAVEERLSEANNVAITTDGWTSFSNISYQSLTAHFIDSDGKLISLLLGCSKMDETHTALNLAASIRNQLTDWQLLGKICGVVTDNAANIKAAIRSISAIWCHSGCFAHSLNLIVQTCLEDIKDSRSKAKSVVEYFKRSPVAAAKLLSLQKQMQYPELRLKNDVVTRWNSTYDMLDRIIQIKEPLLSAIAVTNCGETLTAHDFDVFTWCCKILKPFKDVTEELSSEKGVTVSKVIVFSRLLQNHICKLQSTLSEQNLPTPEVLKMCETISKELQKRFGDAEDNIIWADSTLLDPRFKKFKFKKHLAYKNAHDRIVRKVTAIISRKQRECREEISSVPDVATVSNEKGDNIWSEFDSEISEIETDNSPHAAAIIEFDKYLAEPLLKREGDPLKWWSERKFLFPNVYELMKSRLSIPATSVPSERIFSKTGQIVSDRRSRLSADKVEKCVFISSNLHIIKR